MHLESVALTHQGLVRQNNQDSILALPAIGVFAVADGMGGEQAGDEASQCTIATIRAQAQTFFQSPPPDPAAVENHLRAVLHQANHDVFEISVREPSKRGLGSTASVLCLHSGLYTLAQVGDSRIYLVRNGAVRLLTRDHTLVWMLYEQGVIAFSQIERHPERHLLTQCIGTANPIKIDTAQAALQPGDLFLLCSDGLTGYADEARIHDILLDPRVGLGGRAKSLLDEALKAGGGDNISIILVRVASLEPADDSAPASPSSSAPPSAPAGPEPSAAPHPPLPPLSSPDPTAPPQKEAFGMPRFLSGPVLALLLLLILLLLLLALRH